MPDNLSVTISADSTKARVELALMEESLKKLRKEQKAYAAEANKTGDPTKLRATTVEIQRLEKAMSGVRKEAGLTSAAVHHASNSILDLSHGTRPINRLLNEFSTLSRGVENFGGIAGLALGGFRGGLIALAAFKGFELIRNQLDATSKRLEALRLQAAGLGVRPIAAQALGEIAGAAGENAETAAAMLQKTSDKIDAQRNKIGALGNTAVTVYEGDMVDGVKEAGDQIIVTGKGIVNVLTGATIAAQDLSKGLDGLNIHFPKFPPTEEGKLQAIIQRYKTFLDVIKQFRLDQQQQNIFSKGEFNVPAAQAIPIAEATIKDLNKKLDELRKSQRGATPPRMDEEQRLKVAQDKLGTQADEFRSAVANTFRGSRIKIDLVLADMFEQWAKKVPNLSHGFVDAFEIMRSWLNNNQGFLGDWIEAQTASFGEKLSALAASFTTTFIDPVTQAWTSFMASLTSGWDSMWTSIISAAQTAAATVSSLLNSAMSTAQSIGSALASGALANPEAAVAPFARGGYVRGPGTGASDSILARLSAGEFVLNAASVRRLGLGFLSGLNGFAAGGLVGAGLPRFADGGLVGAGGTPVHLHLGSGSFALHGASNVVDALVVEAHRQQMRSAGTKPSWFAGRPSGR